MDRFERHLRVPGLFSASRALSDSPRPLALLRMVVPLVIVLSPELYRAPELARSPARITFVPEGLGLLSRFPIGPDAASVLQVVALSSAALAILGWWSRASLTLLTMSAGVLFSLSQRQGAVIHDMALFWMAALLAASDCGDAWSLDAWGTPSPRASIRYGVPLFFARLMLGVVYFFPGFHKLRVSGFAWMSAANITNHMHAKWLEMGRLPVARIDLLPSLCAACAVLVVLFELSFIGLALVRRTRLLALGAGLAFHLATQLFFFVPFVSLWACYVVLLPLDHDQNRDLPQNEQIPWWVVLVGSAITLCAVTQGVRGKTDAWPFACYPTFAHIQTAAIPDLLVEFALADGSTKRLTGRESRVRSQDDWGRVFRLSGSYGGPVDEAALRNHAREVLDDAHVPPGDVATTTVYRVEVATAPGTWETPPPFGTRLMALVGPP